MADPIALTRAAIDAIVPGPRRVRYRDARQPGLVLAVEPGGAKTWYLYRRHAGQTHEVRIGPYPAIPPAAAQHKAAELWAAIVTGQDPGEVLGRVRGRDKTIGELWAWYVDAHMRARVRQWEVDDRLVRLHVLPAIGNRQLRDVTKADLRELHAGIARGVAERAAVRVAGEPHRAGTGHRTANHAIVMLRAAWNKALHLDWTTAANPALAVDLFPVRARKRKLSRDEAERLMASLLEAEDHLRDLVLLLLFTGARKTNVMAMRFDELALDDPDGAAWRIPVTKAGDDQVIPLESLEVAILRRRRAEVAGDWVFPARTGARRGHMTEPKKGWAAALKRAGIEDLHVHDLRRSLGSFMLNAGAGIEVISKALGHRSIAVTQRAYAHLDLDPIRAAKRAAFASFLPGP